MYYNFKVVLIVLVFTCSALYVGCSSSPEVVEISYAEDLGQLAKDELEVKPYIINIQNTLDKVDDSVLEKYLINLAQKIKSQTDYFQYSKVFIHLHNQKKHEDKNFSIPGIYFFFSVHFLKNFKFESELASFLALHFSLLEHRYYAFEKYKSNNAHKLSEIEFFSKISVNNSFLDMLPLAIKILYQSKYDPRSFIGLWGHLMSLKKIDEYAYTQLESKVYRENSFYAPLKDPVIQTAEFNEFQKRLMKY